MTVYADNPAGRLHQVITALRRNASQQLMWQAWAAALQVRPDDVSELLRRTALAYGLPAAIESEMGRIDAAEYDRDFAMRWQNEIRQLFGPTIFGHENSATVVAKVSNVATAALEHCSYVLHRHRPERVFSDGELERISQMVADLEEAVRADPGMDSDLRGFLLFHSRQMSRALQDLAIRGPEALEDAFDQAVGATQRRTDLSSQSADKSPAAWKKFGELVVAVAAVLQIATSTLALPGQIRQELEGPPPAAPAVQIINEIPPQLGPAPAASEPAR